MQVQAVSATPRLIHAIAIAVTFALAFGLNLSHSYWMPIAAIVAMKASLDQTTIAAAQRVAGLLAKRTAKAPPQPSHTTGLNLFCWRPLQCGPGTSAAGL